MTYFSLCPYIYSNDREFRTFFPHDYDRSCSCTLCTYVTIERSCILYIASLDITIAFCLYDLDDDHSDSRKMQNMVISCAFGRTFTCNPLHALLLQTCFRVGLCLFVVTFCTIPVRTYSKTTFSLSVLSLRASVREGTLLNSKWATLLSSRAPPRIHSLRLRGVQRVEDRREGRSGVCGLIQNCYTCA